ncbi:MAG: DUF1343 domain-containing protein, partial [Candidatus Sumerlaeia bacterium]|nr:DUF1343 domain-containing protein [Candidatus Sumerlaeia bacterium]
RILRAENRFLLGIEVEQDRSYPNLRNKRVALITDPTAIDQQGFHTVERLGTSLLFSLVEVFVIEDGITTSTLALDRGLDVAAQTQAPPRVHRLNREDWRPEKEMFRHVDIIVWDVNMRGTRVHLDTAILGATLEFAGLNDIQVLVCDRPTIMPRLAFDGIPSDISAAGSRLAYFPIPPYPALTAAEMATLFNKAFTAGADLRIRPMANWNRSDRLKWLKEDVEHLVTETGFKHRENVRRGPIFAPGMVELLATWELAGDTLWRTRELRFDESGNPMLIIAPRELVAGAFIERLTSLDSMGVAFNHVNLEDEDGEFGAVSIQPEQGANVDFLQLAMALHYCAAINPRDPGPDHDLAVFATGFITEGLTSGLTPQQVRRRWIAASERFRAFQDIREGVLLYQP